MPLFLTKECIKHQSLHSELFHFATIHGKVHVRNEHLDAIMYLKDRYFHGMVGFYECQSKPGHVNVLGIHTVFLVSYIECCVCDEYT